MSGRARDDPQRASRKALRTRVSLRVQVRVEQGARSPKASQTPGFAPAPEDQWVVTRDVSLSGAYLYVTGGFALGSRLSLIIELGVGKPVEVEAEVVRRSSPGAKKSGVGVRFINMSASDRLRMLSVEESSGLGRTARQRDPGD